MPNKLIHSTSPYLLQHANNPVEWYEWGEESLQKAKQEDKLILVSIGYSSCHWCHVMERESFENHDIAHIMNENFVCIKVDREERPDVDHIYMEAVQAMGMNGGWPLNVFLTIDQKPFYGGTYFPPRNWAALLINISKAYKEKKEEIISSAEEIKNHLNINDVNRFATSQEAMDWKKTDAMFKTLQSKFDPIYGGLDKAPKFIMPSIWEFLLRYYYLTQSKEALKMVEHTLTMIASGGIFDQLGGGFARYSADGRWFAPHFEKMLYDNAQLLSLYSEAYTITGNSLFKETIEKTIGWLEREMTHPEGGFYSALDADSEGVEGKFYVWTDAEFKEITGPDYELASAWFNVKENGNWEHGQNILTRPDAANEFATTIKVDEDEWKKLMKRISQSLLKRRSTRIRPGLDDKVLLGWNSMMIVGLIDASLSLASDKPLQMAIEAMQFLEKNLVSGKIAFRSYKNKPSTTPAFLEDYSYLINAYLKIYQVTLDEVYLMKAKDWMEIVIENFYDSTDGYFLFSSKASEKLIASKKEIFDNVIPSGNSMMARNLLMLSNYFDHSDWNEKAVAMITKLSHLILQEPAYMANWGVAYLEASHNFDEIVISGKKCKSVRKYFGKNFMPFVLYAGSDSPSELPVLKGREPKNEETLIYVCRNKTCRLPVREVNDALKELENFQ